MPPKKKGHVHLRTRSWHAEPPLFLKAPKLETRRLLSEAEADALPDSSVIRVPPARSVPSASSTSLFGKSHWPPCDMGEMRTSETPLCCTIDCCKWWCCCCCRSDELPLAFRALELFARGAFYFSGMIGHGEKFSRRTFSMIEHWNISEASGGLTVGEVCSIDTKYPSLYIPSGSNPARIFYQKESHRPKKKIMLLFHGGGFCVGSTAQSNYHRMGCDFAKRGFVVCLIGYRLAPENRFPAAIEDAYSGMVWAASFKEGMDDHALSGTGADPSTGLVVAGDSAGANISLVMSVLARDGLDARLCPEPMKNVKIAKMILIYPTLFELSLSSGFHKDGITPYFLPRDTAIFFVRSYLGPDNAEILRNLEDIRVNPVRNGSLVGLPSTVVVTAELDPLRQEGLQLIDALIKAGVPALHIEGAKMPHAFFTFPDLLPHECADVLAQIINFAHEL
eukprot:UC4_evm6s1386